ncbi:protease inhibitor I42 family protein [Algoriphagus namhaensis]|uniref:Protease inhibitor I42 family protein n=1 Tax=Algoriphagus namhaensis TaxID=915353 RepID=A0ABV8ASJ0_9BACT
MIFSNIRVGLNATLRLFLAFMVLSLINSSCTKPEVSVETIEATLGEKIYIELPSNRSSGYTWNWTNKQDVTLLDSAGVIYEVTKTRSSAEMGIEIWSFNTLEAGQDLIVLEYQGYKDDETLRARHYKIQIK